MTGAVVIILILILGSLLGYFIGNLITRGQVPQGHGSIVKQISIVDLNFTRYLTPEFIRASKTPMLSVFSTETMSAFTGQGPSYYLSEWGWYSGKDSNAYMNIWGPGDDGISFNVEISKMAANTLQVTCPAGTFTLTNDNAYIGFTLQLG